MACSDCGGGCSCRIVAGPGASVTGSGLPRDPYVVSTVGPVSPDWQPADVASWSTATVDLSGIDEPMTLEVAVSANVTTITLPDWLDTVSGVITIVARQTGAGGWTIQWPGLTPSGLSLGFTTGFNSIDMVHFVWTGQRWLTILGGKDFS